MDDFDLVMAFARDRQQHMDGKKLSQPDPWMLATYAFDLQRKQNYLYMATRLREILAKSEDIPDGWPRDAPDLLNLILNHNKWVADAAVGRPPNSSADWEARARKLELIIRHQVRAIYADTQWILEYFGFRDPGEGLFEPEQLPDLEDYRNPPVDSA